MTADLANAMVEPKQGDLGWKNWINFGAYAFNFIMTALSGVGAFGPTNGDLSAKYQLLVTPAGFAFSIWGPIFLWEGIFAVAQMLPHFRNSKLVDLVMPGWVLACFAQSMWSIAFAQEAMVLQLVCMLLILLGLLGIAANTHGHPITWSEYFALRGGFSLHLGWIIAASALSTNVTADSFKASPETMLGLAITSIGVICVIAAVFALATRSPDPVVCLVAAWAFNGIRAELGNPTALDNPNRFNPHMWDRTTLGGLQTAASQISFLALGLAAVAIARVAMQGGMVPTAQVSKRSSVDHIQELSAEC